MASLVDVEQLIVSNNKISVIGDTTLYVSTKTKSENTKQSNKQSNSNPPRNKTLERVKINILVNIESLSFFVYNYSNNRRYLYAVCENSWCKEVKSRRNGNAREK